MDQIIEGISQPQQRKILECLYRRKAAYVPISILIDVLYGDDPNGGIDDPRNIVMVLIFRLKTRLKNYGWTIVNQGRGLSAYRLIPIEAGP